MSDLDSFFAKKDKKKLKGKKFTTTDEIAKRLEHTEKKAEKTSHPTKLEPLTKRVDPIIEGLPKEPVTEQGETEPAGTQTPERPEPVPEIRKEEDQWNDFKDDDTVDVSNLKITKLNIEEEEDGGMGDGGEDGNDNSGVDKKDGVWKIEEQKSLQTVICEAVDAGLDENLANVKATVAAMSAQSPRWSSGIGKDMAAGSLPRGLPGSRRKKAAPDITNASGFPTLAESKQTANRKKAHEDFDHNDRRHLDRPSGGKICGLGGKSSDGAAVYKPPSLRTGNRFGALTDHGAVRH